MIIQQATWSPKEILELNTAVSQGFPDSDVLPYI